MIDSEMKVGLFGLVVIFIIFPAALASFSTTDWWKGVETEVAAQQALAESLEVALTD